MEHALPGLPAVLLLPGASGPLGAGKGPAPQSPGGDGLPGIPAGLPAEISGMP